MRRFLRFMPLLLLIVPLLLFACGGGGGDTKSPFDLLSNRVATLEANVANLDNVSPADVQQLRLDLDAIAAQISDLGWADNTEAMDALLADFANLVVRMDDLENGTVSEEEGFYCRPLNMMFLAGSTGGEVTNPDSQKLIVSIPVGTSFSVLESIEWLEVSTTVGTEPTVVTVSVNVEGLRTNLETSLDPVYYGTIFIHNVSTVNEVVPVSVTLGILDLP